MAPRLDCVVTGYYEPPFEEYERTIRRFGVRSEAYRDLKYSFVNADGAQLDYIGLMNHVYDATHSRSRERRRPTFVSGEVPNLAATYLCAFLKRRGLEAEYVNLVAHEQDELRECLDRNPVCVAITTTFYVTDQPVADTVKIVRSHNPSVPIVVGGPLVANHFRQQRSRSITAATQGHVDALHYALRSMGADIYIVESQGELTLAKLIACLAQRGSLATVPNIAYFDRNSLVVSAVEPERNSMDENVILWDQWPGRRLGATIQTRTARSCAFQCAFCNYPSRAGNLTLASVDSVARELDSIQRLGGVRSVVFIDDTFNVPLPRFKALCRLMIERRYDMQWFSYLRCSNVDAEAVELMARSGCKGVFLGIESGSATVLQEMNKAATPDKYAVGIAMLRDHGILTFGSFIAGFPGETDETMEETYEFIERHRPDYYRMQLWYCEAGTPIERRRDRYGLVGQGFRWSHATMSSQGAMDCIDDMFRRVLHSAWLPQWSFDFWIIPYLFGKGLTPPQFREFLTGANTLLGTDLAERAGESISSEQRGCLKRMKASAARWEVDASNAS
jgi:radical SAM PhpK family P-methyltransferase